MKKNPVTGMKDIMPKEMALRDYCVSVIKETYTSFGYTSIETHVVESLENLNSKQGGENEKLIFRILKRGEKLKLDTAKTEDDVSSEGLRYDLTVPLVRYYSAHKEELPSTFKALQMGNVFRADRPQRGRFRQFMQCDIDIFGEASTLAETELILATTTVLSKLSFKDFEIKIGDRRLLKAMAAFAGFPEDKTDSVFITLDKMDKVGVVGVRAELLNDFDEGIVDRYLSMFEGLDKDDPVKSLDLILEKMGDKASDEAKAAVSDLKDIISGVDLNKEAEFKMVFDPTLVRGMGYYTGTIFEVAMPRFGASCGGGGRYDNMVGLFTGQQTPAVGFSIGFERIIMLLLEEDFTIPGGENKVCFLIDRKVDAKGTARILKDAAERRKQGAQVLTVRMNKNKKFQKESLSSYGYTAFEEFYE